MSISRREFLSIIAGASVASLVSPSLIYADEVGGASSKVVATEEMAGLISREIGEIRAQAKGLGLSNIDFDNLSIANGVPTYIFDGEVFHEEAPYFPITDNGKLVFWVIEDEHGVQIADGLVSELRGIVPSEANVAIIYDRTTAYLYREDESSYTPLVTYPQFPERGDVDTTIAPNVSPSSSTHSVPIPSSPTARAGNYSLSVPVVRQPSGSSMCWAASCASISNYLLGTGYTCEGVAKKWYGSSNYDRALSYSDSARVLQALGLSYTHYGSAPTTSKITNNLSRGYPAYGCWSYGSGTGHATVIRGLTSSNSLSLMDPLTSSFTTANYSYGLWWARSAGTGSQMHLEATTCRYA